MLLNTELGDTGELSTRPCDCVFGQLGFDLHLTNVRSQQRLTLEGMTVAAWELDAILSQLIEQAGGSPDSYQYRQAQNEHAHLDGLGAVEDVGGHDRAVFGEHPRQLAPATVPQT